MKFWYENGGFQSSFTPAQLQQIKHATFAQVICQTTDEVQTIQLFVFLSPDDVRNARLSCDSPIINNFDLSPWIEREFDDTLKKRDNPDDKTLTLSRKIREARRKTVTTTLRPSATTKSKLKKKRTTVQPSLKVQIRNVTVSSVKLENKYWIGNLVPDSIPPRPSFTAYTPQTDTNYLLSVVPTKTTSGQKYEKPVEVNIKIQYFFATYYNAYTPNTYGQNDPILITQRPSTQKPQVDYSLFFNPQSYDDSPVRPNDHFERPTTRPKPVSTYDDHVRPIQVYRPSNDDVYNRPSDSYNKPVSSVSIYTHDIDRYSTTERPYLIRPQTNHDSNGQSRVIVGDKTAQVYTVQKRDGEVDLDQAGAREEVKEDTIRVVEIEVALVKLKKAKQ
ncbi:hypothetical protein NQ318_007896 [Aromia moschata]|uniref:Uncharacterized protein n=1 Tax=Aromia moschata TaxID=1265417 RepID=A0AAV8XVL5_9CUCU|nr:hypothetical protein NQ318_007896 [Aromia moschata]